MRFTLDSSVSGVSIDHSKPAMDIFSMCGVATCSSTFYSHPSRGYTNDIAISPESNSDGEYCIKSVGSHGKNSPVHSRFTTNNDFQLPSAHKYEMGHFQDLLETGLATAQQRAQFTSYAISHLFNISHTHPHSFISYLQRIYRITDVPAPVIWQALKYLNRLYAFYPHLATAQSPTRGGILTGMFITALILANHMLEDHAYTNKTWSEVTGISLPMINTTQRQFMSLIGHHLHVTDEEYSEWTGQLFEIHRIQLITLRTQPLLAALGGGIYTPSPDPCSSYSRRQPQAFGRKLLHSVTAARNSRTVVQEKPVAVVTTTFPSPISPVRLESLAGNTRFMPYNLLAFGRASRGSPYRR
eukprot:Partr_v1_DN26434_c0_g1_i3_m23602 putative Cyclin